MPSLYSGVGTLLTHYQLDVDTLETVETGTVKLPDRIQYAWPHATLPLVYVACADRDVDPALMRYSFCVVALDDEGGLSLLGEPVQAPGRPIHVSTDPAGRYLLTAYDKAPGVSVHRLAPDGAIGDPIPTDPGLEYGIWPHQIRVTPDGAHATLIARGHSGNGAHPAAPGAIRLLGFDDGLLTNLDAVDMTGAPMLPVFNPRHLDFHPSLPLAYACLEAQNVLVALRIEGDRLVPIEQFTRSTLVDPDSATKRQLAGAIHVHPSGRTVYVGNRADTQSGWMSPPVPPLFESGENSIAVFALGEDGEPVLVQSVDTHGFAARTFGLDPSGRVLVVGNTRAMSVADGGEIRVVPAGFTFFRVAADGTLAFARWLDVEVGAETLWWSAVV